MSIPADLVPSPPAVLAGLAAAVATWALVALLIKLAPQLGLVDRPNARSLHTRVTPRGGGIGFVLAVVIGALLWAGLAPPDGRWNADLRPGILWFCAAALFVAGVSLRDDFHSLGAGWRFACHVVAALVSARFIGKFDDVALPGIGTISLGVTAVPLTALWILGLTNVYNFMDGIDGIAATQGIVAGVGWLLAASRLHLPAAGFLGALLAGGAAGFLAHNWSPASIFMGDVGSAFLGFAFGALPLVAQSEIRDGSGAGGGAGRVPGFALILLWPFVSDGLFTFFRRLLHREPVWKAHRSHLYQRLVQAGLRHSIVAAYYGLWAIVCLAAGFIYLKSPTNHWVAITLPLTFLVTWAITVRREFRKGISRLTPDLT